MAVISDTPNGYSTITPYFTLSDAEQFIDVCRSVFDAQVVKDVRNADQKIQHARLKIGNSIIMLNQSSDTYGLNVSQMHIYVENADASHALALKFGATSIMEPNDRPHCDRMAGVVDPCKNIWWLATPKR